MATRSREELVDAHLRDELSYCPDGETCSQGNMCSLYETLFHIAKRPLGLDLRGGEEEAPTRKLLAQLRQQPLFKDYDSSKWCVLTADQFACFRNVLIKSDVDLREQTMHEGWLEVCERGRQRRQNG